MIDSVSSKENEKRSRISLEINNKILVLHEKENTNGNNKSISQIARETCIDRRKIRKWLKQQDQIKSQKDKRITFKLKCNKTRSKYSLMVELLFKWI